jgi:DNA topoisomerase I
MSNLVIVESPSKAKTINKFLGEKYVVISSYGHVRDLLAKNGSVIPDKNFHMIWDQSTKGKKQIQTIQKYLKTSENIYLATDPDREGEAISWHVLKILKKEIGLKQVFRVIFHEITKESIQLAISNPKQINQNLVNAYLARRTLDYLVGFTLSPILWRKLPGSKSAGRVQSVALRIIADKEIEINKFVNEEYWSIEGEFVFKNTPVTGARLTYFQDKKVEKKTFRNELNTVAAKNLIQNSKFYIKSMKKKEVKKRCLPPFKTSTLQQESGNKLKFSAQKTMQVAQQLYEGIKINGEEANGLITYMRTDSISMSDSSVDYCRKKIEEAFGRKYMSEQPKKYKTKSKNAQEAHEAIRPTNFDYHPKDLINILSKDQYDLYNLIWKRSLSSQMKDAIFCQSTASLHNLSSYEKFRITVTTKVFDGFLKIFEENITKLKTSAKESPLSVLEKNKEIKTRKILVNQHFTQPPPRFSEANIIKKLEELSIGRPSTYASILHTLKSRNYIIIKNNLIWTKARGIIVTNFLTQFFSQYVEYKFSAKLEEQLDNISNGKVLWKDLLKKFWTQLQLEINKISKIRTSKIIDILNSQILTLFTKNNYCPKCKTGKLSLKNSYINTFIGCSRYPECNFCQNIHLNDNSLEDKPLIEIDNAKEASNKNRLMGSEPISCKEITLHEGPYGFYFQWQKHKKNIVKPKRIGVPKNIEEDYINIQLALLLDKLPRIIGKHPITGNIISSGIGRYGPYIKMDSNFMSLNDIKSVTHITIHEAIKQLLIHFKSL